MINRYKTFLVVSLLFLVVQLYSMAIPLPSDSRGDEDSKTFSYAYPQDEVEVIVISDPIPDVVTVAETEAVVVDSTPDYDDTEDRRREKRRIERVLKLKCAQAQAEVFALRQKQYETAKQESEDLIQDIVVSSDAGSQWGDGYESYLQSFFEFIGWRQTEQVRSERISNNVILASGQSEVILREERGQAAQKAQATICQNIQEAFVDLYRKSDFSDLGITIPEECKEDKNEKNDEKKKNLFVDQKNGSSGHCGVGSGGGNYYQSSYDYLNQVLAQFVGDSNQKSHCVGEVIVHGEKCTRYVVVDEQTQRVTSFIDIPYRPKEYHAYLVCAVNPIEVPGADDNANKKLDFDFLLKIHTDDSKNNNGSVEMKMKTIVGGQQHQDFSEMKQHHENFVTSAKIKHIVNDPVIQKEIVAQLCRQKQISDQKAMELEKQIEFARLSYQALEKIKEHKKQQAQQAKIEQKNAQRAAVNEEYHRKAAEKRSAGASKEQKELKALAFAAQKAKNVIGGDQNKSQTQQVKNAKDVLDTYNNRVSNIRHMDQLPQGAGGYQGKLKNDGTRPWNKNGDLVDRKNNSWHYNEHKDGWDVRDEKGHLIEFVGALKRRPSSEEELKKEKLKEDNKHDEKGTDLPPQTPNPNIPPTAGDPKKPTPPDDYFIEDEEGVVSASNDLCESSEQKQEKTETQLTQERIHRQLVREHDNWVEKNNVKNAPAEDQHMITSMLNFMEEAKNSRGIQIAQQGLQAWTAAQHAQSDQERAYYKNKFQDAYLGLQRERPDINIEHNSQPVKIAEVDNLFQDYKKVIDKNWYMLWSSPISAIDKAQLDRIKKRNSALWHTKNELQKQNLEEYDDELSYQARGYLMANHMNYAAFDTKKPVTSFQHCLTQELLGIVELSAQTEAKYGPHALASQLARHNSNLAVVAQQLNQNSQIQEAAIVTDLTHFVQKYSQSICEGVCDGVSHSVVKWVKFANDLCKEPKQTIGYMIDDYKKVAVGMYGLVNQIIEFSPGAYDKDEFLDNLDYLLGNSNINRVQQRETRNNETIQNVIDTAQNIVNSVHEKSLKENVAGVTEFATDIVISNVLTDTLLKVCQTVGDQALQVANLIEKSIPPVLETDPIKFATTPTGQVIAIVESTSEDIAVAIVKNIQTDRINAGAKIVENSKKLFNDIDNIVKLQQEQKRKYEEFRKSIEPYLTTEKLVDVERLKAVKGVPQIEKFREYTDNFKNLEKLTPEEILYLNCCDWLAPQAKAINAEIELMGGLKFIDPVTKSEVVIKELDLFHSLLGEMKPQFMNNVTKGGHLPILELKSSLFEIGDIKSLENGFFDMVIKRASNTSNKSCFPLGTTIQESVDMVKDAVSNFKKITNVTPLGVTDKLIYEVESYKNGIFKIYIQDNIAKFHPFVG